MRQEEPDNFVASTSESSLANQPAAQQLLATNLKEADPAMYEIIENASCLEEHCATRACISYAVRS